MTRDLALFAVAVGVAGWLGVGLVAISAVRAVLDRVWR